MYIYIYIYIQMQSTADHIFDTPVAIGGLLLWSRPGPDPATPWHLIPGTAHGLGKGKCKRAKSNKQ